MTEEVEIMTPEEFEYLMKEIDKLDDPEGKHVEADNLMLQVLSQLGYSGGIKVFLQMEIWYS